MNENVYQFEGNLSNILQQKSLRWIFVGGKGGVGKTTVSSSLAILLSQYREKVLIISTDPAHNLSDSFDQKMGSSPTLIKGFTNLYGLELDPKEKEEDSTQINEILGFEADSSTTNLLGEMTSSIPGIDEAMCLGYIMKIVNQLEFSVVVFDTAPTGHTLRLLNFPNLLEKGLAKLISLKARFTGVLEGVGTLMNQNVDEKFDKAFQSMDQLKTNIEIINAMFKDAVQYINFYLILQQKTTFIAVCIPEFLSMYETERLIQELFKFEIDTRNIVINQVLISEDNCKMCSCRMAMQKKYLDQIRELFEDFHITTLPLKEQEIRGTNDLLSFSKLLLQPPSV